MSVIIDVAGNEFEVVDYVCIGLRRLDYGKPELLVALCRVMPDNITYGPKLYFSWGKRSSASRRILTGNVYSIPTTKTTDDKTQLTLSDAKFQRQWGNPTEISAWQLATDAEQIAAKAVKLSWDVTGRKQLYKLLEPLRVQYASTDRLGRLALELSVIQALRGPRA